MSLLYIIAGILMLAFAAAGLIGSWALDVVSNSAVITAEFSRPDEEESLLESQQNSESTKKALNPLRGLVTFFSELARCGEYSKLLFNLSGYVFWPFGKFILRKQSFNKTFRAFPDTPILRKSTEQTPSISSATSTSDELPQRSSQSEQNQQQQQPRHNRADPLRQRITRDYLDSQRTRSMSQLNFQQSLTPLADTEHDVTPFNDSAHGVSEDCDADVEYDAWSDADSDATATPNNGGSSASISGTYIFRILVSARETFQRAGLAGCLFALVSSLLLTPAHLVAIGCCFFCVVSVPMAKLNYILIRNLARYPLRLSAHLPRERAGKKSAAVEKTTSTADCEVQPSGARNSTAEVSSVEQLNLGVLSPTVSVFEGLLAESFTADSCNAASTTAAASSSTSQTISLKPNGKALNKMYRIILCTHNATGLHFYKVS